MSDDVTATWATRELPILRAALARLDGGDFNARLRDIQQEVGLDATQTITGVRALETAEPPYVEATHASGGPDEAGGYISVVSERARRELGSWPSPSSLVDQLVAALISAAETEPEADKKSRLRSAADAIGGFARDVAVGVVAARIGR